MTLGRLVDLEILYHHEGDYWTLSSKAWQSEAFASSQDDTTVQFVKARIANVIFNNEIPEPRDIIIITLINTCDVFRFIFVLDEDSEEPIELICKMDLIGRSIGEAVAGNLVDPMLRRPSLSQADSSCPATSNTAQSTCSRRQHACAVCGSSRKIRTGFSDPPAVFERTPGFFGRFRDKLLGASAWAQLPESAGLLDRVQNVHTPAQRAGCPRDLADDLLSLHASDPQFLPESNLRFALSAPLIASVYLGDALSFTVYAMASQPEFYNRIRSEADALFDNGDPGREQFTPESTDVTRRFIIECLRLYSIVPTSVRNVMNTCLVEGYELPEGVQVFIAQSAAHYMEDVFPDPKNSIPTAICLPAMSITAPDTPLSASAHTRVSAPRWMEFQLVINLMMIAHYFTLQVSPANYKLKISPFPSLSLSKKLKFAVAEQRREINV